MMMGMAIMVILVVLMIMTTSSDRAALPHRSSGRIAHDVVVVVVRGHGFLCTTLYRPFLLLSSIVLYFFA